MVSTQLVTKSGKAARYVEIPDPSPEVAERWTRAIEILKQKADEHPPAQQKAPAGQGQSF